MKISLSWLNEYLDLREFFKQPDELSRMLTAAGLEVEGYSDPAKAFQHVVVGHIVELGRHPNADKLTLCRVDVGDGHLKQIVCGAKNHKAGDKVIVALPGAVLPGDFAIKLSKIRDVESQGMLCSESELGFKSESEGIVILPQDAPIGSPYAKYANKEDVLFEINVTPNRADCLSHVGLARELSCLLDRKLQLPEVQIKSGAKKTKDVINVQLKNSVGCPRYCGRAVFGVRVGPSPSWLVNRLESVGVNSINNIVDVTNYVMLEFGQPLHAFDLASLQGQKIIIDHSIAGESFKTFDGTELKLTGEELTIRDEARAVALAGVIGGLNSGVTEQTQNVFLEAAYFNPRIVRRSSRMHGVDTDSSQRFSRGTDYENVLMAMNRAVQLFCELAGGESASDYYDLYPEPKKTQPIVVYAKTLTERLGYFVDLQEFAKWMSRLHCKIKIDGDKVIVEAPTFRVDLEIEMDLVEEYARLNGYDKIPECFPPLENQPTKHAMAYLNENRISDLLKAEGFLEARNYNFVSPKWQNSIFSEKEFSALGLKTGGSAVRVQNPLSEETSVMRQSLLPGLFTNLLHNSHHGVGVGRMFEVGSVFAKADGFIESPRVAMLAWGYAKQIWDSSAVEPRPLIYDLKSAIENVLQSLRMSFEWRSAGSQQAGASQGNAAVGQPGVSPVPSFAHPGQIATLFCEGRNIGFISALHPAFKDEHKIRHDVAVLELDLSALMRGQPRIKKLSRVSKFPAVERDFALVMPISLAAGDVVKEIKKSAGGLLQDVSVFDIFKGVGLPEGSQSVAFRITLQDVEATLSEEQVNKVTGQVLEALEKKFGIKKRA